MMFKSVEELQEFGRSKMEAAAASAAAVSRGVQQIAAESSTFAKRSVEDGSAATTRLMSAKSLDGAVQVQADYARTALEGLVAQANRMGALMMAVGTEAAKPFGGVTPAAAASRGKPSGRTGR